MVEERPKTEGQAKKPALPFGTGAICKAKLMTAEGRAARQQAPFKGMRCALANKVLAHSRIFPSITLASTLVSNFERKRQQKISTDGGISRRSKEAPLTLNRDASVGKAMWEKLCSSSGLRRHTSQMAEGTRATQWKPQVCNGGIGVGGESLPLLSFVFIRLDAGAEELGGDAGGRGVFQRTAQEKLLRVPFADSTRRTPEKAAARLAGSLLGGC